MYQSQVTLHSGKYKILARLPPKPNGQIFQRTMNNIEADLYD
jgi:hypothetical protein